MLYKIAGKIWKLMPRKLRTFAARSIQVKFTVSAAGVITNEKGEVLLLNHLLRPMSGWGVPGGFLESGEQPEAAFRREIREETGLDLKDVTIYRARTLRRHIEIIFLAKAVGEASVQSREIIELGWFTVDDVPKEMSLDQQFLVRKALEVDDVSVRT
jgi:ADP-ribose pyrophosphatase YjhB (NUDIX family)